MFPRENVTLCVVVQQDLIVTRFLCVLSGCSLALEADFAALYDDEGVMAWKWLLAIF